MLKAFFTQFMSLHQDVTHGFDVFDSVIWRVSCFVPTCVVVIIVPSCAKADSGITAVTVLLLVISDADSCFRLGMRSTHSIEPFNVTVEL